MKKFCLMSCALALAGLASFWIGGLSRDYATVEGQVRGKVFPKVEIHVAIQGIPGTFQAGVKGLGAACEVIERRDPNGEGTVKIPGRVKYGDITLKRGVLSQADADSALHKWHQEVQLGKVEGKDGSIVFLDSESQTELARYEFFEAWPCKWKGFSAPNADAVFPTEEIELVVHKVHKVREAR